MSSSESDSDDMHGPTGPMGPPGIPGRPGSDGKPGLPGTNGSDTFVHYFYRLQYVQYYGFQMGAQVIPWYGQIVRMYVKMVGTGSETATVAINAIDDLLSESVTGTGSFTYDPPVDLVPFTRYIFTTSASSAISDIYIELVVNQNIV